MQVLSFPGCCTAKVLVGFGQEANAGWSIRPEKKYTEDTMRQEIHRHLTGPQVGRHYGLVFATLTTRQTMGIKVLTEMGFKDTEAKVKNGHRETQLHGFYICPAEYIDSDYAKNIANRPVVPVKRYVKDLNYQATQNYNYNMRAARDNERRAEMTDNLAIQAGLIQRAQSYRAAAKRLLEHDYNFN